MTKNELMQMARKVGVSTSRWQIWPPTFKRQIDFTPEQLASFTNAILERAAVECDNRKDSMTNIAKDHEENSESRDRCTARSREAWYCAESIRSLKLPTN